LEGSEVSTIGERIKAARAKAGWSLRELAERAEVSHTAISKYERGLDVPSSEVLIRLAQSLDLRIEYFLRPMQVAVSPPKYRKRSTMSAKQEAMVLAQVQEQVERQLSAESLFPDDQPIYVHPDLGPGTWTLEDMESAAVALRGSWNLGLDTIDDLMWLLESRGIRVVLVQTSSKFDACTFWANDSIPVVAVRAGVPGDRQRLSLAHELGHLVLGLDSDAAGEKAAYRFAGAFLVPKDMVESELGKKRAKISLIELERLKQKWGLSMAGWLRRAADLGIISSGQYVSWMKRFRRQHWHLEEPSAPYASESPCRLEQLVIRALAEDMISAGRAGELLARPIDRSELEAGISDRSSVGALCS
jgi:transcriptional regulator with XRE-family HTH domain